MLLALPNKPAVINAQVIALSFDTISMGGDLHAGKPGFAFGYGFARHLH